MPLQHTPSTAYRMFRYRLYPTRLQADFLTGQLSEACALYNAALSERRWAWKMARHAVNYYEQANQLKDIRAAGHLGLANFSCCQNVLHRVDLAFIAFFRRVKQGVKHPGFPRFHSHRRYDSLTFPSYRDGCRLLDSGRLHIQGAGDIKVKLHRPVDGRIKTVTIKREAERWFVTFSVECTSNPLPLSSESVGIDMGLTSFAVLSDGTTIENPHYLRDGQARIRVAQRRVARRKIGGNGRRKASTIFQRAHAHVRHQRADFQHKTARALVNRFGLIAVEDLKIKWMAGGMLGRPIYDAGWGGFLKCTSDKAASAGRTFVRVDPNGTTQTCSQCGAHVPKTLNQRRHLCPVCGLSLSRDENAAREILRRGLRLAELTWPVGACVSAEAASGGVITVNASMSVFPPSSQGGYSQLDLPLAY